MEQKTEVENTEQEVSSEDINTVEVDLNSIQESIKTNSEDVKNINTKLDSIVGVLTDLTNTQKEQKEQPQKIVIKTSKPGRTLTTEEQIRKGIREIYGKEFAVYEKNHGKIN